MNEFPVLKSSCRSRVAAARSLILSAIGASFLAFAPACSMVNEDLDPCAEKPNVLTNIIFTYRYNMQRDENYRYKDLVNDHVGSVYLYIFDEKGLFLHKDSLHRKDMKDLVDFSIHYDTTFFHPGHKYQLVAMAQGNHEGYEASLNTPGFVLQNQMIEGVSTIQDYEVKLDRDGDSYADFGIINYKDSYGNSTEMIDTLWSTKPGEIQYANIPDVVYKPQIEEIPNIIYNIEIPLMRITNAIKVNLTGDLITSETKEDDYNILIYFPKGNGRIGFLGNLIHDDDTQPLYYRSLRKSIIPYTPMSDWTGVRSNGNNILNFSTRADDNYAIYSEFGVSRLCVGDESSLQVRDGKDNSIVCEIENFSEWLAKYYKLSELANGITDDQEFLDRQYDFDLDLEIRDNRIYSWQVGCEILGWSQRYQILDW